MNRPMKPLLRSFLVIGLVCLGSHTALAADGDDQSRPNIVLIMADDNWYSLMPERANVRKSGKTRAIAPQL